jgi:HSP20 family protein
MAELTKTRKSPSLFGGWPIGDDFFNDFFGNEFPAMKQIKSMPTVNIKETESNYQLELSAPGLKKEDFNVEIDQQVLKISFDESKEKSEEEGNYTRREFYKSSFQRSFMLPENVNDDEITAEYKEGILYMVLPKYQNGNTFEKKSIAIK